MYEFFLDFCGFPPELVEGSETLQKCIAAGSMGLACVGFALICYMVIVIFRGWK